ncbi:MAG: phosphoheptose isomerase [uncultured bacterium]|nr:MAG: phosphoheptose isomerase [uncultured bacterium]HBH17731.1 phosphoheptose isomerase [Cyanobacteria bacterium UBA9579]
MKLKNKLEQHRNRFFEAVNNAEFTVNSSLISPESWFFKVIEHLNEIKKSGKSLYFIGNGASASIASHFAADLTKNGLIPSYTLTDNALLTCFSNDYSYEDAYMEILKKIMKNGDALIAISSSGTSKNILKSAEFVKENFDNSQLITFTAFNPDNPLRKLGEYNLYLNTGEYSFAESGHAYYLHLLTDLFCNQETERMSNIVSILVNSVDEMK